MAEKIEVPEDIAEINRLFLEKGWTDGLPVIPPTEKRVADLLQGTPKRADDVIALIPPRWAEATVEKIAINAVMAGCLPEHLPLIMAAVEGMVDKKFNLYGIQTTTHPCGPLLVINGPVRKRLRINCGPSLFGPGPFPNAVIGRALRLVLLNIGGAIPGKVDKATHGQPGKFTYVMGENEEESPWEPLSQEKGFRSEESTVTVIAAEAPHNVNDHWSTTADDLITTIAGTLATQGSNNILYQVGEPVVLLGPEHAKTIAKEGLTKLEVKKRIVEKAHVSRRAFPEEHRRSRFADFSEEAHIPVTPKPENIIILVGGGAGRHSMVIPTFGNTHPVTKLIDQSDA